MLMNHFVIEAIAEQLKELQRTLNRNITQVSVFSDCTKNKLIIGRTPVM